MIKNRPFLLLFISACMLWSTAIFSRNDPALLNMAITSYSAPMHMAMLKEKPDKLRLEKITPANNNESTTHHTDDVNGRAVIDTTTEIITEQYYSDEEIATQRQLFLKAEEAVKNRKNAKYFQLAEQLKDYPLYPYLQYQWLKKNLQHESQVKQFLQEHQSSRYASHLKGKWLYHLAKKKQWQTFLEFYSETSNTSLNCYYHQAQFNSGDKQAALNGAAKLWAVGKSQPKVCDPLFSQLKKSDLFNQDLFWQRFDAALQNNKTSLAKYVKRLMPPAEQKTAELWLNLHRDPERYIPELLTRSQTAQSPLMFTHAITRLINKDIYQAIVIWDNNKQSFAINKKPADKLEKRLAFKLAHKNESGAYERLGQLNESDNSSKTRRIRVALSEQNWPRVIVAIEDLSSANQKLEKWQYWLARAYQETGRPVHADEIFSELSGKRDFYGYLAADRLNRLYQLDDNPVEVTSQQIDDIKNHEEFRVAFEFLALDRVNYAKLQWWHALRQLDKSEFTAAAKLAQQWHWDEIAIFTIAKVKQWDDIEMRFPLSYAEKIHENAIEQDLNPVILFGLVRRESAFNKDAHSPVGARGLMQIMPQTGKQIARDLNERWPGKNNLYNPVKNLKYGSYYYQKLLNQFDGHYALALAAYNAGPNRVKKWLPDESIPADIWIETIPYRETRNYVTSVLVYAMIYQQRIQSNELTMNDLTREVQPLEMNAKTLTMNDMIPEVQPLVMTP